MSMKRCCRLAGLLVGSISGLLVGLYAVEGFVPPRQSTRTRSSNRSAVRTTHHPDGTTVPKDENSFHPQSLLLEEPSLETVLQLPDGGDDDARDTTGTTLAPHLVFPGGGIFFYWQAGVMSYLRQQGYNLSDCQFSGASAGALTATLAASGTDFYEATELALDLAAREGVWDRSSGLQGIWGTIIEEWLEELLPSSMETINGRLSLLVTPVPTFGKARINKFHGKDDLIACNMASVHLPWFLDNKWTSNFRDQDHIDGSFLARKSDYCGNLNSDNTLFLEWKDDPAMQSKGGFDIVKVISPKGIWSLVRQGERYAAILEEQGVFRQLTKAR